MNQDLPVLLIIDDDEAFNVALARTLARHGYQVASAFAPQQALEMAQRLEPEYVVLDLNLNGESGLTLIQQLLEVNPDAHILLLTGFASIPTAVNAIKLGARQYLAKPATTAAILKALTDNSIDLSAMPNEELPSVPRMEWEYIQRALDEHDGNIAATARALKMHRRTLQRKLAKRAPNS